ncbi:unnamed protein product [Ambrosiozyma monospora]|uniref:Unnamed protein product n=1 Tax=Ambrosiozyma monospora TaxID=43982 RepID=A0A9W6YZN1_AMBMO|nr:unnamed protein product [Ambrosiozyma monospora]
MQAQFLVYPHTDVESGSYDVPATLTYTATPVTVSLTGVIPVYKNGDAVGTSSFLTESETEVIEISWITPIAKTITSTITDVVVITLNYSDYTPSNNTISSESSSLLSSSFIISSAYTTSDSTISSAISSAISSSISSAISSSISSSISSLVSSSYITSSIISSDVAPGASSSLAYITGNPAITVGVKNLYNC